MTIHRKQITRGIIIAVQSGVFKRTLKRAVRITRIARRTH